MADKEVTVKITTETDIAQLDELDEKIEEILDKSNISMELEVEDSSVDDAASKTEELESELENIDGMVVTPEVDTSSLENAQASAEDTASSMDSIATAAVGISATAGFDEMAATADRINTSWNRLELTFQGTGVSMDTLRNQTNALTTATGRSGGVIRDYFNQMGIAGVTNTELLGESFEALAGKSYQTGQSIESMESKMQTMVLTGNASNRMLKTLGLSAEDLANAMGVSADQVNEAFKNMTPEQRLQAITKAMGDGAKANDMYKNSYEGLKAQADAAMAGLMGAVGQAILPIVVPALQAATQAIRWLTDGFKALPGPVQAIIGGIGGFAAIITATVGVLGVLGNVISSVQAGLTALRSIQLLNTIATQAAAAAQWLWNAAMSANPIGILIIAIAALVAILTYLYFNNEQVREAIDNLGQTIMYVAGIIWDNFMVVLENLRALFENFTASLGLNVNDWKQAILAFLLFLPTLPMQLATILANTIAKVLGFKGDFVRYLTNAAKEGLDGFVNWIVGVYNKFHEEVEKILDEADRLARELPPKIAKAGLGVVGEWVIGTGESSPGYMYDAFTGELDEMYRVADKFKVALPSTIGATGAGMVSEFGGNNLSISGGAGGGLESVVDSGTVINVYGDVDSERRVQEIVDAVRRELAWNNATAGRTV